jgi:hypothetical protein
MQNNQHIIIKKLLVISHWRMPIRNWSEIDLKEARQNCIVLTTIDADHLMVT